MKKGFTLAEVLITLGIIGIVAALTIPVLIQNHKKQETATKVKAFYSIMSQAFYSATVEHGDFEHWDAWSFGDPGSNNGDGKAQLEWLKKYLLPYIKTVETNTDRKWALVALPNGSGFSNYNSMYFFCLKYADCKKQTEDYNSRTRFVFQISKSGFKTYDVGWKGTREELFTPNANNHKCPGAMCAKLLEFDGWEIKDDYPW